MNLRPTGFIVLVCGSTLLSFLLGRAIQARHASAIVAIRPADEPGSKLNRAELSEQTRRAMQQLAIRLDETRAENERLRADADESHLHRADRIGVPTSRHEIQLAVQRNLRVVKTLRDSYLRKHGQLPRSLDQIVGPQSNLKRLMSADGEDYASVSLHETTLTVTTAGGDTIWYRDESGPDGASKVDYPAHEARYHEMEAAQRATNSAARRAYHVANGGKDVTKDLELLPYFTTPQDAADYLELIEAMKAAGKY